MAILFAFREFLPEISWEEIVEEIFFSYFVLFQMTDLRFEPKPYVSNKTTQYLLDYGD